MIFDVSHHQDPKLLRLQPGDTLIARATYGTALDKRFAEHCARAKDAGARVGAYAFFRQGQNWESQLEAFDRQVSAVALDLYPAIDLEHNEQFDGKLNPALHNTDGRRLATAIADQFGQGRALIYMSATFPAVLGSPGWLSDELRWLYWIADWSAPEGAPRVKGVPRWHLHQCRVAPHPQWTGPGPIDQNVAADPAALLLTVREPAPPEPEPAALVEIPGPPARLVGCAGDSGAVIAWYDDGSIWRYSDAAGKWRRMPDPGA